MTTATALPKSIGATIHQDALSRVPSFFNATSQDILNELLQNARRAGATMVHITLDGSMTTVADDGRGVEDPLTLLAFGQTGWNEKTASAEHAAGMGLYTLARRGVVKINSRTTGKAGWEVTLMPQNFTGEAEAPLVETGYDAPTGTSITFSGPAPSGYEIERATKYYPLPVKVNGEEQPRHDYLQNAVARSHFQGMEIGVFRGFHVGGINFHGIVVERAHMPVVYDLDNSWYTAADVRDAKGLELTLPARKDVVETDFTREMREAALVTAYRGMLLENPNPDVSHATQREAAKAGFNIADASPKLKPWEPKDAKSEKGLSAKPRTDVGPDTLVITAELEAPDEQALARAAEKAGILDTIMEADGRLAGYPWYDRVEKVTAMDTTVWTRDATFKLSELRTAFENITIKTEIVERIEIELTIQAGDRSTRTLTLTSDLAFPKAECDHWEDAEAYIAEENTLAPGQLQDLMVNSFFEPSDDSDADSWETQEEECRSGFERLANQRLKGNDEAAKEAIMKAAMRHMVWTIPDDTTVMVTIRRGEKPEVVFEKTGE